jgi:hypothetical protein
MSRLKSVTLADALLRHLQSSHEALEQAIAERFHIEDSSISFQAEANQPRLLVRVARMAQDGGILSEQEFALEITELT